MKWFSQAVACVGFCLCLCSIAGAQGLARKEGTNNRGELKGKPPTKLERTYVDALAKALERQELASRGFTEKYNTASVTLEPGKSKGKMDGSTAGIAVRLTGRLLVRRMKFPSHEAAVNYAMIAADTQFAQPGQKLTWLTAPDAKPTTETPVTLDDPLYLEVRENQVVMIRGPDVADVDALPKLVDAAFGVGLAGGPRVPKGPGTTTGLLLSPDNSLVSSSDSHPAHDGFVDPLHAVVRKRADQGKEGYTRDGETLGFEMRLGFTGFVEEEGDGTTSLGLSNSREERALLERFHAGAKERRRAAQAAKLAEARRIGASRALGETFDRQ